MSDPVRTVEPTGAAPRRAGMTRGRILLVLAGVAALIALVWGFRRWQYGRTHETTDNAQIEGHVIPVIPKVGGYIERVLVRDNQVVQQGDTLVVLDRRDLEVRLAQAEAEAAAARQAAGSGAAAALEQARAERDAAVADTGAAAAAFERARSDVERFRRLAERDVISRQQLETAEAAYQSAAAQLAAARNRAAAALATVQSAGSSARNATARLQAAEAAVDAARLQLSYAVIVAPATGRIAKRTAEPGQVVQPGQALMAVVDDQNVWVVANLKETQLKDVRPGNPVEVTVDAYGDRVFRGRVESIQGATGARFALLPPDNATGNFTKVVQRVPVKIVLDPATVGDYALRPGMSVEVSIATGSAGHRVAQKQ